MGRNVRGQVSAVSHAHITKIRALHNIGIGKVLIMVACGPSINEIDLTLLKGIPNIDIMSINKPDKRIWPTTYWAFCDLSQYNRNKDLWDSYDGMVVNSSSIKVAHKNQVLIKNRSGQGFSKDLTSGFFIGRSTTYANLQTALWMGYTVFVFGIDMCAVNGKLHHYGVNPDVQEANRLERFKKEAEHYQFAGMTLPEHDRKKIYFCSSYNPWSFTKLFNHLDHKEAIPFILDFVQKT